MSLIKENLDNYIKDLVNITNTGSMLAEITKVNHKKYICECVALNKKGEKTDIILPDVPIPKMWATKKGGIFMAPSKGTVVLITFLENDLDYPVVSSIMGSDYESSDCKDETLIIKHNSTEIILDDKIYISANGKSLGKILEDMVSQISELQTIGSPTKQTIDPAQVIKWQIIKTDIQNLFKE